MHTSDVLTSRRLCVIVEIEAVFMNDHFICLNRLEQAPLPKCICTCGRVTFSDASQVVVLLSICMLMTVDTKMSLFNQTFQPKFTFLASFLQRLAESDHSIHVIMLLSKLYQQTHAIASQHRLSIN